MRTPAAGAEARARVTNGPVVSPSAHDPVVRAVSEVVGGPVGWHSAGAAPSRLVAVPAVAVLVGMGTAAMAVAALLRQHCRSTLWASPDQFTHACYSDLPPLHAAAGLGSGLVPYLDAVAGKHLTEPVGTGALAWLAAAVAPGGPDAVRWFFDVCVLLLVVALAVTVACVARLAGRRRWDAALVAASPVLLTSSLVSLDLVAVALTCAALLAFSRQRPVAAGVLVGLAVSVRPTALVLPVAVALLAVRSGKATAWLRLAAAAVGTWALVNVPVLVLSPDGWAAYWQDLRSTSVGYGSALLLPELAAAGLADGSVPRAPAWLALTGAAAVAVIAAVLWGVPASAREALLPRVDRTTVVAAALLAVLPALAVLVGPEAARVASMLAVSPTVARAVWVAGTLAVLVAVALFALSVRRRPRLPVVVLLLLVGFGLTSPVLPVQAALWVLPFAALAVPSWRWLLPWAAVEAVYVTGTWFYVYGLSVPNRGLPPWAYGVLLVARLVAWAALAWRAVDVSVHPQDDPVRTPAQQAVASPADDDPADDPADDDPAAGPVEHAPDALVVAFR